MSTVLVVDDEYVIADILGYALEDAGYKVEKAPNGKTALDVLEKVRIDLVITDYMMPIMNGEELAKAIRSNAQFADLPVILMSGAQASIGKAIPDLFSAVFDKPFDTASMVARVRAFIGVAEAGRDTPELQ